MKFLVSLGAVAVIMASIIPNVMAAPGSPHAPHIGTQATQQLPEQNVT
jgi:hypothetical protein